MDDGYVHLTEGTPLPYSTQFANTPFWAVFSLNYKRLCRFVVAGDRVELDEELIPEYIASGKIKEVGKQEYYSLETTIEEVTTSKGKKTKKKKHTSKPEQGNIYELTNAAETRKEIATGLLNSLAVLRGGAKQASFHADPAPKVLIMAGLKSGNPIFNTLFKEDNGVYLNVQALKEIASDYKDRLVTPVYVGIRTGFIKNEETIRQELTEDNGFIVTTPIQAAKQLTDSL
jgi:CRISPR-associated protein Cst2